MEKIGERLTRLLKERGYTQREFALMCGVTDTAMCRYLKDERSPNLSLVANMARVLNTTVEYLISGKEKEDNNTFDDIYIFVEKNATSMTSKQKFTLIKLLTKDE